MLATASPHVVLFAAVQRDACLGGRTVHLAEGLADGGARVMFVNIPGLRYRLRKLLTGARPLPGDALRVIDLPPIPFFHGLHALPPGSAWCGFSARRLRAALPELNATTAVVSTPWWLPVLRRLKPGGLVYDCIDLVDVHAPARWRWLYRRWERELVETANTVLTVSRSLERELRAMAPGKDIRLLPNGVPGEWLEKRWEPMPRRELGVEEGVPVLGFVGALFEWIDFDLLAAVARRFPHAVLALVGPRRFGVTLGELPRLPNVRLLGPRPFSEVPRWISAFDVCLIPFRDAAVARAADPVKLYEYLALGRPVVSSLDFGQAQAPMLVGRGREGFCTRVAEALAGQAPSAHSCRDFARAFTWQARSRALRNLVGDMFAG